ncbi:hypothetical protein BD408DRAFT_444560 [Parasitella parasitica]|nr:hypothetical protein BD408DRAFT_444560 [Parasitella parasitica]
MKHTTRIPQKRILENQKPVRIVIPLAHKDKKLALISRDESNNNNKQFTGPEIMPGVIFRIFHCSVCNTTFRSKLDYDHHIDRLHKNKQKELSSKKDSRQTKSSIITNDPRSNHVARKKSMNPAKISYHGGLADIEDRLNKSRFKHNFTSSRNINSRNLGNHSYSGMNYHTTTTIIMSSANRFSKVCHKEKGHRHNTRKNTFKSDTILPQRNCKKRKINMATDTVEIESDQQKIKSLFESSQGSYLETRIEPIKTATASSPHPIINDPDYYCRACHASHSSQEAYQQHLQIQHHIQILPYLVACNHVSKRNPQKTSTDTRFNKLFKMTPIHINLGTTPSPLDQERIKNVSTQPDLDNPTYYCKSCHITKPNRRSYLTHLSMIHKMTKKRNKASNAK